MTFGVNHLGHFALVQDLLADLAHPARIVVVSSGTHDPAKFTGMPSPQYTTRRGSRAPRSRLGRRPPPVHHVQAVQRALRLRTRPPAGPGERRRHRQRLRPRPDAGFGSGPRLLADRAVGMALRVSAAARPSERQQRPGIRCAPGGAGGDPRFDGVTGAYFEGKRPIRSSADSYDREQGARPVGDERTVRDAGNLEKAESPG